MDADGGDGCFDGRDGWLEMVCDGGWGWREDKVVKRERGI